MDTVIHDYPVRMKCITIFDFDGTLTTKDSMLEFIKFCKGPIKFYIGLFLFCPLFFLMRIGLLSRERVKQLFFYYHFRGYSYTTFRQLGESFGNVLDCNFINAEVYNLVCDHKSQGDIIYVITASIEEWVKPWCIFHGISNVIGSKVEVKNGVLTGRFISKNCNGIEKVNRFIKAEPNRQSYKLIAYGNSKGDKEIIAFADQGIFV